MRPFLDGKVTVTTTVIFAGPNTGLIYLFSSRLTNEQLKAIDCAIAGHSLLLTGKAGSGKSQVVKTIVDQLRQRKKVVVLCSSGISCSVYGPIKACTVHSFYVLQTADMPSEKVICRSTSMAHCVQRMKDADMVIWDEAGMSSRRTFELINAIHHRIAEDNARSKPFGGKQVILVGDFLQLRPVRNHFDGGQFMFESALFDIAVLHRFQLTRAMRQVNAVQLFVIAIEELRLGSCSASTEAYLQSLSRPIPGEPIHIYFRKLSVQMHNFDVLSEMAGELMKFDCKDTGKVAGIACPAEKTLMLKPSAKVILVWNVSEKLRNGSSGKFIGMKDGHLEVQFDDHVNVVIKRYQER